MRVPVEGNRHTFFSLAHKTALRSFALARGTQELACVKGFEFIRVPF